MAKGRMPKQFRETDQHGTTDELESEDQREYRLENLQEAPQAVMDSLSVGDTLSLSLEGAQVWAHVRFTRVGTLPQAAVDDHPRLLDDPNAFGPVVIRAQSSPVREVVVRL